jgi:hypothetical protein
MQVIISMEEYEQLKENNFTQLDEKLEYHKNKQAY